MTSNAESYGVFIGSETGLLKGVKVGENSWHNVTSLDKITREKEVTALCWGDEQQTEVCVGHRDGSVDVYNHLKDEIIVTHNNITSDGNLKALRRWDSSFVTCTDKGNLTVSDGVQQKLALNVGENIYCMAQHPVNKHMIATGGKENDLKIWNLQESNEAVFKAKNVKHDFLNLRVPVWVTDTAFFPDNNNIVTCTGHHQVRVYDPSCSMRRPVLDIEFDEYPLMSLSLRRGYQQVIVGNTHGVMALVDLRGKGYIVQKYKGFAGGIRSIECHPNEDVVVSCGLDRYLRIHDINSRQLLNKYYMKSRLNRVLLADKWESPAESSTKQITASESTKLDEDEKAKESDEEELWDTMGVVKTKEINTSSTDKSEEVDSDFVDDENEEMDVNEESSEEAPVEKKRKRKSTKQKDSKKKQKSKHK